uniref:Peptidase M14 carboxypeptidase A domain-containing protein n=1 Tax=Setaria digitata TaxID=48799 RepID=A0A915Q398_9BILA
MLRISPENEEQMQFLFNLYLTDDEMLNFWKPPVRINETVDVMIYPGFRDNLEQLFKLKSIPYHIKVADFGRYLESKQETAPRRKKPLKEEERRLRDDSTKNLDLFLGEYHSYDNIVQWLKNLEMQFKDIVKVTSIGVTSEGRTIYGVKLGTKHANSAAPVVWIDAGIHAREWAAVHTALYLIKQLIAEYYLNSKIANYLGQLDIYIYPCLNPDGYEYTRLKPNDPSVRLWRKNRGSTKFCKWKDGNQQCCQGVDLNRNFAFHFGEIGSSSSPCSDLYHGKEAFSEPETRQNFLSCRAVRDAVLSLRNRMQAYITLHTYSQLWIYPYSNAFLSYSSDVKDLKAVAAEAVKAIKQLYGTNYHYGTGPEKLNFADAFSGGSSDWAKATGNVKYSYTIELRPSKLSWNGFILDKRELIPTGKETFEGIKVVIDKVIDEVNKQGMTVLPDIKARYDSVI